MANRLPKNWRRVRLDDISTPPQYGWTTKSSSKGKIRYLRTTDISSKNINWGKVPYCNDLPEDLEKFLLKENDIVISRAGSVGLSFIVTDIPHKTVFASYLIRFKPLLVDPYYVYYFLKSSDYWDHISRSSAGIAIQNVNAQKLANLELPLPPLQEQKRISLKLDKLFKNINSIQSRLDEFPKFLDDLKRQLFHSAVDGTLTANWRKVKKNNIDGKKYLIDFLELRKKDYLATKKDNSLFPDYLNFPEIKNPLSFSIPNNWTKAYFTNLGELTRGRSKNRPRNDPKLYGGAYPFIQTGDVANAFLYVKRHKQTYNEKGLAQSRLFPSKTLCITIAANIAETAILTYPACFPDSIVGFIPYRNKYLPEIALYYLRVMQEQIEAAAPATAQKNINIEILSKIPIPVPPIEEQKEIVNRVKKILRGISKVEKQYTSLLNYINQIPSAVLGHAYSGRLVPQNPSDESVVKLIERINKEKEKLFDEQNKVREKKMVKKRITIVKYDKKTEEVSNYENKADHGNLFSAPPFPFFRSQSYKNQVKIVLEDKSLELLQIIKDSKQINPLTLWKESKYKDDIDAFYDALKNLIVIEKKVKEVRLDNKIDGVFLELTNEN
ncbi:MAG: restriction endonuclease subunit S [Ignavibacteriales bacterium]|nr:restriction endonuclease subunit S [Ignavibacteriales bacterium]